MTVLLAQRADLHLEHYRRVAWGNEAVGLAPAALERIGACRDSFMALLDAEPDRFIYGVTSGYGQDASRRISAEERRRHAARPPLAGMTAFGPPLPERVARGIVFARLANFIEGHAAVTPALALAVAELLDGSPLPPLPTLGNQSAGEILTLSHLFGPLANRLSLAEKEMLALINGSPCASAFAADTALVAERRLSLALQVFALSAEALKAPPEAWDAALEPLWGDAHERAVLGGLRGLLAGGDDERRVYQAPVSWRILPRVLGQANRARAALDTIAATALTAVSDNPVYVPPAAGDSEHPHGRVLANGGYHNAAVPAALDTLAAACADLALLCDRQVSKLLDARVSLLPDQLRLGDGYLGCLAFGVADVAERARNTCSPTLLPGSEGGGFGQNDVASPVFSAFEKTQRVGNLLDAALAILAVTASQALAVTARPAPPALVMLLDEVRDAVPPLTEARALGPQVEDLATRFGARSTRTEPPPRP